METFKSFENVLYSTNDRNFEDIALRLFRFQSLNNAVYASYLTYLGRGAVTSLDQIPFLPISLFKTQEVQCGEWMPEATFGSSGTTGAVASRHRVKALAFYLRNTERNFSQFFGPLQDYHFLMLLPSYLEREGSSLVSMATYFINKSESDHSGFYLDNLEDLVRKLQELKRSDKKVVLLGVTFALLDLAEKYSLDLSHCLIMETGGMKGKRQELIREEVHRYLCDRFNVPLILSEYGMTELFSQAYSLGNGKFRAPATMKVRVRDINDPFQQKPAGATGAINIIDLANIHTCAFVETQDLGKIDQNGYFEVLGRIDNSDIRGCNLLVE